MRSKDMKREGHHRGGRHKGKGELEHRGPKTFRRGRAIAFLDMMNLKRSTIKQQLEQPEFQSIQPILVGELKAIDMVINEFSQLFEIHESEMTENNEETLESHHEKGDEPE
ncbi:hypothetical protein [Bacillus haynesii]|uniref:hypothetical protein n=1 Tax=Bacillus haynesii TaxID=1925021 RepID=UPI00227F371B|nr:hypothetical protein [Bacillus haynesii]MCY7770067.1 hypothetical protein [Bacillus haynesii]MCY7861648.1 hypothetical protein [Bacillus haynesii]MCY7912579.1 hypothetical protein [Bacillus haynesii]MCY7925737.1 hypothetical protein [Bacillus haynesii]MCY8000507.1 hypothetical protein [Bacillus haynesii]